MAIYETIFILDSLLPPKEIDGAITRFSNIITSNGGKVRRVDKWGKRRLAYEIHKKQYGFYCSIEFDATGNIPKELESEYNFNDKVIRYLTYRYDKRKLRAMAMENEEKAVKSSVPSASDSGKINSVRENRPIKTEEKTPISQSEPQVEDETQAPATNNEETN